MLKRASPPAAIVVVSSATPTSITAASPQPPPAKRPAAAATIVLPPKQQQPRSSRNPFARFLTAPLLLSPPATTTTAAAVSSNSKKEDDDDNSEEEEGKDLGEWLRRWGLPSIAGDVFARRGIRRLYAWQHACLDSAALRSGGNLVYTLPTSSGKTLVAEIALLRCLVLQRRSALLVLPFVSIVAEKARAFEALAAKLGFAVEAYHGSRGTLPTPPGTRLAVATIEKANGVANSLIEEGRVAELGCVVVDEVHMVGDGDRGALLELLLAKLLYFSQKQQQQQRLQILAMSATVPNAKMLGAWMRADTYEHGFRPVPLREFVKIRPAGRCASGVHRIVDAKDGNAVRDLKFPPREDFDGLAALCAEVVPDHSVLVFCSTKKNTESAAQHVADNFAHAARLQQQQQQQQQEQDDKKKKEEEERMLKRDLLLQKLAACTHGGSVDPTLRRTIPWGVAFHNAGLTSEERELLEEAFRQHVICVICSTSTLAAGVNLPARRVILRSPYIGPRFMTPRYYKQMIGRAGRAGLDDFGESFLCIEEKERKAAFELVNASAERVSSMLLENNRKGFERLILEGTCGGYAKTRADVSLLVQCTLAAAEPGATDKLEVCANEVLASLLERGFLVVKPPEKEGDAPVYEPTPLGIATFHSCFSPEEATLIHAELSKAREGLVLNDELHLCYLLTPVLNGLPPDWRSFLNCISAGSEEESHIRVFNATGCNRTVVEFRASGASAQTGPATERSLNRFFNALVLLDLIGERSFAETASKFNQNRGGLQSFLQTASAFAGMTVAFCKRIGWWELECVLSTYVKRLNWGVKPEIVPLTEIKGVGRLRARSLWNIGFHSVRAVATAKPEDLMKLVNLGPFRERAARMIIRGAKELLEKQARELQKQAEEDLDAVKHMKRRRSSTSSVSAAGDPSFDAEDASPLLQTEDSVMLDLDESLSDEPFPSI